MIDADIDLVLLRSGLDVQLARADLLAGRGLPVLNDPGAHRRAQDKLGQATVFLAAGVPHPRTAGIGHGILKTDRELVAKPRRGSSGLGVHLIGQGAVGLALERDEVVQERIVGATEYRVTVVGGRAVAWAEKIPAEGDFRANLDRGGKMRPVEPPEGSSEAAATRAVEALGLDIGGVDLMVGTSGPVVIEVNAATTLHGADEDSTKRVLEALIDLCSSVAGEG